GIGTVDFRSVERLDFDVGEVGTPPQRAGQDQCLAGHVRSRQVVARIGLRVAELPRLAYGIGEAARVFERRSEKAARTAETAEDRLDAVAGFAQLRQGVENRQSGAGR